MINGIKFIKKSMPLNQINIGLNLDTRAFVQALSRTGTQVKAFGKKINTTLGDSFKSIENKLRRTENKINRFGRNMSNLGGNLTQGISVPLGLAGGAALKTAADFERLETQFKTAFGPGNEKAASKFFDTLKEFSAGTPFQFQDIAAAAQSMLAFGFSATEAREALGFLGDISAGTGANLSDLTLILGQAKAIGAVYTQDLRQLANRGIPVFDLLKEQLNVTGAELDKMVSGGQISFEILQEALRSTAQEGGRYEGATKAQSKTLSGLFSTLKDNVALALAQIGGDIVEAFDITDLLSRLTERIKVAVAWFSSLDSSTKKNIITFAAIAAAIGPVLLLLGKLTSVAALAVKGVGLLVGAAKLLSSAFVFLSANPITALVTVLGVVLAGTIVYVIENFKALKAAGINSFVFLKNGISRAIAGILQRIDNFVQSLIGVDLGLRDKFKFEPDDFVDQPRLMGLGETFTAFGQRIKKALGLIPPAVDEAKESIEDLPAAPTPTPITQITTGGGGNEAPLKKPKRKRFQPLAILPGVDEESAARNIELLEALDTRATVFNDNVNAGLEAQREKWQSISDSIAGPLNQAFEGVFSTLINEGKLSFKSMGDAIKGLIVKLLKAVAVAAALAAIFTVVTGGGAGLGKIKSLLEFGDKSLFKGFLGGFIPGLASGGLAFGPTLAVVGDNANAQVDPEVVAPLSKLKNMLGGNGYVAETRISGDDLLILIKQAEARFNRYS